MRLSPRRMAVLSLALLNVFTLTASLAIADEVTRRRAAIPHLVARDPVSGGSVLVEQPSQPNERPDGPSTNTQQTPSIPPGAVRHDLVAAMKSNALGKHVTGMVTHPASGRVLLSRHAGDPATPASTTKLATAAAALHTMGPGARLTTRTVRGRQPGTVVLVGGGDPTLASPRAAPHSYPKPAKLGTLAKRTAKALRKADTTKVRLKYDATLFTGPEAAPTWEPGDVAQGYVGPVTALSVDAARIRPGADARSANPPRAAAKAFASLLESKGITVRGKPSGVAGRGARARTKRPKLAAVHSPPVSALVERMLTTSDNDLAEALGRHVALAVGRQPSFHGATTAVVRVLRQLGVSTGGVRLHDCSGLSHGNRLTARALTQILALAAAPEHPGLRPLLTGLPIAGYSGTLTERYEKSDGSAGRARGLIRAKTGTLTGVTTLAGVAYRPDGQMLVFAFFADKLKPGGTLAARQALDDMAATLVR